jgi:membrane protein
MSTTASRAGRRVSQAVRELGGEIGATDLRKDARQLVERFSENGLIVFASALAFRILFGLVPLALFGVALLGYLSLDEVWRETLAPEVRDRTSAAAFTLIDRTAEQILTRKEGLWLTVGALFAFWEMSAAIRITMRALDRIYGEGQLRPLKERFAISFALALPVAVCVLGAAAASQLLPRALDRRGGELVGDVAGRLLGWSVSAVLVTVAVALLLRFGPQSPQPFRLAGAASVFIVVTWTITSTLFGIYTTSIAAYGTIFGGFAFAIILMTFVYVSAMTFLVGLQIDALVLDRVNARRTRTA